MQYIRLGHSGLEVSRLCLGTVNMGTPDWKWSGALGNQQKPPT
ncbi:hypothetical protein SAMN05216605_10971 [Pseudomonas abietaniphila]|uniref:Uncharacterized protein n=1 Tax=Pseudomonas abietaniphila TaxID=89065 RepID=A0A1G8GAM4_9PSED|nr:hypothetical protein SAMN05216605_10971 [Pseudomonas abietaniphila]